MSDIDMLLRDLRTALKALEKVLEVVREEHHADTCGSVLSQESYPCNCWKSAITNAITESLTGG